MPNIITKCFYFCACLFFISRSCSDWIDVLKWNLIWYRFASEKGKCDGNHKKNVDSLCFFLSLSLSLVRNGQEYLNVFFFKCEKIEFILFMRNQWKMCLVWCYFSFDYSEKRSVLVNEYQYLYFCDTWQCKTLDVLCGIRKMHSSFFNHPFALAPFCPFSIFGHFLSYSFHVLI